MALEIGGCCKEQDMLNETRPGDLRILLLGELSREGKFEIECARERERERHRERMERDGERERE